MMSNKIIRQFFSLLLLTGLLMLTGCSKEKETPKSMEEIRKESGVPVKVMELKYKPFQKYLSFFAKLNGIKESTKGSAIGGKIETIKGKVGDYVKKDQIIVEFQESNPGVQIEQARTAFENAEKTYNRMKALLEAGETSQANYDGAQTNYLVSKRNYEALKQVLFVESPIDGTIIDIKVHEGDNVKNETQLFTVAQLHKMRAKVWASDREIAIIKKGMNAAAEINGKKYFGKVVEVSLASDPYKQAFYAEVEFDNSSRELRSGITADIKIMVYENRDAIVIPRHLVMKDDKGTYIFVESNNTAVKRYVQNGTESGAEYEISAGLKAGEKLITQGGALLAHGVKVKVIE